LLDDNRVRERACGGDNSGDGALASPAVGDGVEIGCVGVPLERPPCPTPLLPVVLFLADDVKELIFKGVPFCLFLLFQANGVRSSVQLLKLG
jgi:hypothetical protein